MICKRWVFTVVWQAAIIGMAVLPGQGASAQDGDGTILINEINYNSSDAFNPDDWTEFHNRSAESVDLSGWTFTDVDEEVHGYVFPAGTVLEPDGYVVVCRHLDQFGALFPEVENVLGEFGFGLSGGGESVLLTDGQGTLVDSLSYDDMSPWPDEADGEGATLQLIDVLFDNADVENWKASDEVGGSPGRPNNPRRGFLVINEFMASNTRTLVGPQGDYDDWTAPTGVGNAAPWPTVRPGPRPPAGSPRYPRSRVGSCCWPGSP